MMIADHPYLACTLALFIGIVLGWWGATVIPQLLAETAADDQNDVTGIGA